MNAPPALERDPLGCACCPVRDSAVCAALSTTERSELARLGRRRRFSRGEIIIAAGDDSVSCGTLVSGAARLSRVDAEGVDRTLALLHPGGFLGQLFAAQTDTEVVALTDSELCLFRRADLEASMRAHPAFMERILRATMRQLDETRDLVALIGRRDARARVAGIIALFANDLCRNQARFDLPLTRGEMASLLGLTIETVSRQLGALEQAGVITREGARGLLVPDLGALRAAA